MIGVWVLFLGFILVLLLFATKLGTRLTVSIVNVRILKWVWGAYAALLVVSMVVLYLLPKSEFLPSTTISPTSIADIYNSAQAGKLDQIKGIAAERNWSFAYTGSQIQIINELDSMILVQRKSSDDGKIEVSYYATPAVAYNASTGIDYSKKLKTSSVTFLGDKLRVTNPPAYSINLAVFEPEFTLRQFSPDGKNNGQAEHGGFAMGEGMLYVRIPANLEIVSQNKLQFVGQ